MNVLFSLLFSLATISTNQVGQAGLAIYSVDQPYPDFTKSDVDCYYCFDVDKTKLSGSPILSESDIVSFDWDNQQVTLTDEGMKKVSALDIPLPGMAVAFVLNGEPIYGFWFWNSLSAYTCDRVCATPTKDFKITFGLPGVQPYGSDPRFNSKLKSYVTKNLKQ
ncbi:MAG: hypothetical protein AAGA85_03540 [Bacteroidota bacterium]